ncbi:MAG: hypothetical protein HOV81_03000 [Kofleriaceae bacterium]|nr:hypothetical protein [Kofleriaceae bacterium]
MSRLWVLCALVSGCIYAEPINQRPSLDIIQDASNGIAYRGSLVKLTAKASDPENQAVFFQWRAYACTDATPTATGKRPGCDEEPFYTGLLTEESFNIPMARVDASQRLLQVIVLLEGQDDYGATAKPIQELLVDVANHDPLLTMRKDSRLGYVEGHPVNVYADVSDPDDGPRTPTLVWDVFSPQNQPDFDIEDIAVLQDPTHPELYKVGKKLTPYGIGDWEVQLVATDPLGATFTDSVTITVVPDSPPCIAQVAPIVASAGNALPITEPTLFQVNVVKDDLDPFPSTSDPVLGTATFHWSIMPPGTSAWQALGANGNAVPLDPSNYAPGDILELRVEIGDRVPSHSPGCTESAATCSVSSDSACIQRLTWRVEVR